MVAALAMQILTREKAHKDERTMESIPNKEVLPPMSDYIGWLPQSCVPERITQPLCTVSRSNLVVNNVINH